MEGGLVLPGRCVLGAVVGKYMKNWKLIFYSVELTDST